MSAFTLEPLRPDPAAPRHALRVDTEWPFVIVTINARTMEVWEVESLRSEPLRCERKLASTGDWSDPLEHWGETYYFRLPHAQRERRAVVLYRQPHRDLEDGRCPTATALASGVD